MRRYGRLLWIQWRASLHLSLAYRWEFLLEGATSFFWTAATFVPLFVVFSLREGVAGWTQGEALVVLAFFQILRSILDGAVNPGLAAVIEHVRKGTLDFVLLKPADAEFLVSTQRFTPSSLIGLAGGLGLGVVAFARLGRFPTAAGLLLGAVLLTASVAILHSLWMLVVCASFRAVRVDNLSYLLGSIFDAARWPRDVFRGFWRVLLTWIIPLGLLTSTPAEALLGRLHWPEALLSVGVAATFVGLARWAWTRSLSQYTSASS